MIKNDIGRIRTCAGKPNGFLLHRLNHSATMSSQKKLVFGAIKIIWKFWLPIRLGESFLHFFVPFREKSVFDRYW